MILLRFISFLIFFSSLAQSACSSYKESFIINEINTFDNWVELYRNPKNPPPTSLSNWSVTVCNDNDINTCETKSFNYNQYTNGSFPIITFSNGKIPANRSVEVLVKDNSGNVIDYFNIQQGNNPASTVLESNASQCGFNSTATPCKYYYSSNSGQRDIARIPDGGCSYQEFTGSGTNTKNTCNSCNISPSLNTCWVENFASANISNNWTIIKQDNYVPQVVNGKLMLTVKSGNIATGMTLGGQLPADNNFLNIEFEQNAYGGTGADGITLALSNSAITPIAGAFGGSLGYAQRTGINGFAGGWLGFGMDEYGNFSNPTEGRIGGPGFKVDSFAIRGSGSGTTGYNYIAGTSTLSPGIDVTATQSPAPGHKYRLSINTYNAQTWVKVERDTTGTGLSYSTIINWADATQSATSPQNFRLNLTGSTGGSTNYHSVDNFTLNSVNCGTICQLINPPSSLFDAWDTFRSISDRNISTKIVNKPFNLAITALNSTGTALQDFNGTVCATIINQSGNTIATATTPLFFTNQNTSTASFSLNRAIGENDSAGIKLYWKKNVNTTCPLTGEDNTTIASDRFAVRPASFTINAPNAIAGVDFNLTFTAPNFSSTASIDYNETVGSSFDVTYAEHNASCPMGTFTPVLENGWSFANGSKGLTTRYDEVGVIDVNISDESKPCSTKYARADCDDGDVTGFYNSLTDLPIGTTQAQITIKPHHFDLNATLSNSNGAAFTYLSTDLNMSAKLDLNITAKNGEGNTTKNYDKGCYAKSTTLTLPHSIVPTPLTKILYTENLSGINTSVSASNDLNLSLPITIFTQGLAPLSVDLNFDRNSSKPLNPFDFSFSNSSITDTDNVTGSSIPSGTATFVYGRTRAYDIKTDQTPAPNPIEIEVYGKNSTHTFLNNKPQNVLYWYRNTDHNAFLNAVLSGTATDPIINIDTTMKLPNNGLHEIYIVNDNQVTSKQTITLVLPSWLTISPANNTFIYQFFGTSLNNSGVQSGTFQGADFNLTPAKTIIKKGVKVFR
jgi:MSHA biogenesis protein MshQ